MTKEEAAESSFSCHMQFHLNIHIIQAVTVQRIDSCAYGNYLPECAETCADTNKEGEMLSSKKYTLTRIIDEAVQEI